MELYGNPDVIVTRIAWSAFQARIVEFTWIVRADRTFWDDYPNVTYTPPVPFYRFKGVAIEPTRQYKAGETIHIVCADVWRKWERDTARLKCDETTPPYGEPGTSKIRLRTGMFVEDAIQTIIASKMDDIPGGFVYSMPDVTDVPNPDAPSDPEPEDHGEWNIFHEYSIHNFVTYKGQVFIATTHHKYPEFPPDEAAGWDLYFPAEGRTHAPILYSDKDATGQKVATWLHDIIDQTENGVALIEYDSLNRPRLHVYDYTTPDAVSLKIGDYTVINPSATQPLLVNFDVKNGMANKYKSIIVEGAGKYSRKYGVVLTGVLQGTELLPGEDKAWYYRFYFPETNVLGAYIDAFGKFVQAIYYSMDVAISGPLGTYTFHVGDQSCNFIFRETNQMNRDGSTNDHFGQWFAPFQVNTTPDITSIVFTNVKFRYTVYDGPLIVKKELTDAALAWAGDFPIHTPKYYTYDSVGLKRVKRTITTTDEGTGETVITTIYIYMAGADAILPGDIVEWFEGTCHRNYTVPMRMMAEAYFKRYCDHADHGGTLTIVLNGITGNIRIGTPISNFSNARVQAIEVNPTASTMKLTVSDQPIRELSYRTRDYLSLRSELYGNERNRVYSGEDTPLMPDMTLDGSCFEVYDQKFTGPGAPLVGRTPPF